MTKTEDHYPLAKWLALKPGDFLVSNFGGKFKIYDAKDGMLKVKSERPGSRFTWYMSGDRLLFTPQP